jgi:hypothetical protein
MVDDHHAAESLTLAKRSFDCFDEAGSVVFADHKPIENYRKMVWSGFGKGVDFVEVEDLLTALHSTESAHQQ